MPKLGELALITGDLNVGHRELDIRNWRGNVKKAGFLPRERAYFDRFTAPKANRSSARRHHRHGLGWVDVGRRWAGEVDGPYSWWSNRGKAFDTDTGWRIDYHLASPAFARARRRLSRRARALLGHRWSDHARGRRLRVLNCPAELSAPAAAGPGIRSLDWDDDQAPPLLRNAALRRLLQIGNYIGALLQWRDLQEEYEAFFSVVDLHALTQPNDPAELRRRPGARRRSTSPPASNRRSRRCTCSRTCAPTPSSPGCSRPSPDSVRRTA
jgi:hypothetical protein